MCVFTHHVFWNFTGAVVPQICHVSLVSSFLNINWNYRQIDTYSCTHHQRREREREQTHSQAWQAGSVAHAWRTEMMIAGGASSILAAISVRYLWLWYRQGEVRVAAGMSKPMEDMGECGRQTWAGIKCSSMDHIEQPLFQFWWHF